MRWRSKQVRGSARARQCERTERESALETKTHTQSMPQREQTQSTNGHHAPKTKPQPTNTHTHTGKPKAHTHTQTPSPRNQSSFFRLDCAKLGRTAKSSSPRKTLLFCFGCCEKKTVVKKCNRVKNWQGETKNRNMH